MLAQVCGVNLGLLNEVKFWAQCHFIKVKFVVISTHTNVGIQYLFCGYV